MSTTTHPVWSLDHWISRVNSINAALGEPAELRLAAAGELISGRFGGLHQFGEVTVMVLDRHDADDSIAVRVTDEDRGRVEAAELDDEIRILAR